MKIAAIWSPFDCLSGLKQVFDNVKNLPNQIWHYYAIGWIAVISNCPNLMAGSFPDDSTKKYEKRVFFKSMTWGYPDRAADFEENLFKDAQLHFNVSMMHSSYNLSPYRTDEWLLQESKTIWEM